MVRQSRLIVIVLASLVMILGCGLGSSAVETAQPVEVPASQEEVVPDLEATATTELLINPLFEPPLGDARTLTPGDDPGPGPWMIFAGTNDIYQGLSLWSINAAGTHLVELESSFRTFFAIRPGATASHAQIATVSLEAVPGSSFFPEALRIIDFHDWTVRTLIASPEMPEPTLPLSSTPPPASAEGIAVQTLTNRDLVWSPDGRYLAFIAADQSPEPMTNVYLYDAEEDEIRQLTTQSSRDSVYQLNWSPDSEWLVYAIGAGQGEGSPFLLERRAIRVDGTGDFLLADSEAQGLRDFVQWAGEATVIFGTQAGEFGSSVETVELNSGVKDVMLVDMDIDGFQIVYRASSPDGQVWLFTEFSYQGDEAARRLLYWRDGTVRVLDEPGILQVWWEPALDSFMGLSGPDRVYTISIDGTIERIVPDIGLLVIPTENPRSAPASYLPPQPGVSPQGSLWLWSYGSRRYVGAPFELPTVIAGQDHDIRLTSIAPDDSGLFLLGDALYFAPGPDFTLHHVADLLYEPFYEWRAEWIK